jgi:hypothetical protein
MNGSF